MDVYDTIYAVLAANNNSIGGRTVIQKLVYFCTKKIDNLNVPPYVPHYYGPFSPGLREALEKMVAYSFLYEASILGNAHEGYKYGLTDDGREIAKKAQEENRNCFEAVGEIVKTCKEFCELKTHPLSYAAKIHYLVDSHHEKMSFSDAIKYAKELGWKVSEDNVDQGARLLEKLGLVRVS